MMSINHITHFWAFIIEKKTHIHGGPVVDSILPMQGGRVWSLIRKLRSHMLHGTVKTDKLKQHPPQIHMHNICTWLYTATLLVIVKNWKEPKCLSVSEWLNRLVPPFHRLLLGNKKELTANTCDDLDGAQGNYIEWKEPISKGCGFITVMLSKWRQCRGGTQISGWRSWAGI